MLRLRNMKNDLQLDRKPLGKNIQLSTCAALLPSRVFVEYLKLHKSNIDEMCPI